MGFPFKPSRLAALAAGAALTLGLGACSSGAEPLAKPSPGSPGTGAPLVVGSANFPESQILADIYSGALNAAGISASTKPNIGSREVYVRALQDGSIDLVPDYSGNLLRYVDKNATAVSAEDVMKDLPGKLPQGLKVLNASTAEDKDSIVVTEATAAKYGLKTLADLGKVCDKITLGMPPEAQGRPQGLPGLKAKYGCVPGQFLPFSDGGGPVTVKALLDDKIQAADVFTTSPLIAQNHLLTLEDPANNFAAQQVVPLVRTDRVDSKAAEVLNKVSASLTTGDLVKLNDQVSGSSKQNPEDAAAAWLKDKGLTQ
ncbi:ABC transporter substrate-binding protein [Pseudarthrobacter enclensis]|uniref:Osmoprotectant transport system substrate-binding protein n=1 Tax=Pseudarthrobacter enclensis TaxID=993070 RepID=A0ABT9RY18_9MICC|nr:ABC transporter substrate-binding protein [Pseudarthrobacter enclensis]MDP9890148.1 osmoprotectant transport system substrate-binding protein [Pseudarthrobacter enclensis]